MLRDTTLALGVAYLFNKMPSFVNIAQSTNGGGGFDPSNASPLGAGRAQRQVAGRAVLTAQEQPGLDSYLTFAV